MFRYVAALFTILVLPINASAQTPAESNPEAVYISSTYGIPQLNGRLLLPTGYRVKDLSKLTAPITSNWEKYLRTFRLDTASPEHMIFFAAKTPGRIEQILRTHSAMNEELIQKAMNRLSGLEYNLDGNEGDLNQFEARDVMAALAELYNKEKHKPQKRSVPVTILLGATLYSYDFKKQKALISVHSLSTAVPMPRYWYNKKVGDEEIPLGDSIYFDIPEEQANEFYNTARTNPLGKDILYIGVETSLDIWSNEDSVNIDRIVYSFSWNLSNPFFEYDVAAKRKVSEDAEAERIKNAWDQQVEKRSAQEELETEGFNREKNAARFESAGLQIGAPPPDSLAFKRYGTSRFNTTQKGANFPAASAFFHTKIAGGEVAFLTSDGQAKSPVVYYARYFSDKNLAREALRSAAIKKLGQPQNSNPRVAYWWDTGVPVERAAGCRSEITDIRLGNAYVRNNEWSQHPLWVNFYNFPENCGIMGAMSFSNRKYAVADTAFFNKVLSDTLAAEQQKAKAMEAKAEKEFEF